jgi:hypothetical protein
MATVRRMDDGDALASVLVPACLSSAGEETEQVYAPLHYAWARLSETPSAPDSLRVRRSSGGRLKCDEREQAVEGHTY